MTAMSWGLGVAIGIPVVVGVLAVAWPERVERGKSAYDIEARRRASTRMAKREDRA
ncbi:hypothetical protein [Nocardia sp. NRRL WC-3656]|uniref:hypothetical protein n=1 Tax=Nocardia sp. NRRL WC-3656 TaxID=1463824 RepID=UPI000B27CFF2|nr:hypothetical protein [Nocardia sp. NRRL WC-3656]